MNEELEQVENQEVIENNNTDATQASTPSNDDFHATIMDEHDYEHEFDTSQLEKRSLSDLVELANATLLLTPRIGLEHMEHIQSAFETQFAEEKQKAENAFDEGEHEGDFAFEHDGLLDRINEIKEQLLQAEKEEKQRIEEEKKSNLKAKEALLNSLEELTGEDETSESIDKVKEIQRQWKAIRAIPQEHNHRLWERYHALLDKFYDTHSINIELKELDRRKNLEAKIELTKKVEELSKEPSLKRSFILLNKYHEEFKNIGSVPIESREPIWQAFKKASDAIYSQKRKQYDDLESKKEENLKKKELLLEKARMLDAVDPRSPKDWKDRSDAFDALFAEWKTIGPVPKSNKDQVWINFNGIRNDFFQRRKKYHKEFNSERNDNLKAKEALCEKVEALQTSTDWAKTAQKIKRLQGEWKKIGPVPPKVNQAIWKRFRKACDTFFDARSKQFEDKHADEAKNLESKQNLIKQLQQVLDSDPGHKIALNTLRTAAAEWKKIGHIPHKAMRKVNKQYETVSNAIYSKYREQAEAEKSKNLAGHYESLVKSSGEGALDKEIRHLKRRIAQTREEIAGIENNMSFFSLSKNADSLLKDFDQKIKKLKQQIDRYKSEISVINSVKRDQGDDAGSEAES